MEIQPHTPTSPTSYAVGLCFARHHGQIHEVVLQRGGSNKPKFLINKWNGPGGKMEIGEFPWDTISREFYEECGVAISRWNLFATLTRCNPDTGETVIVHFLYVIATETEIKELNAPDNDEPIMLCHLDDLDDYDIVPEILLLIPFVVIPHDLKLPIQLTSDNLRG